jgi:hypothetical protein
MSNPQGVTGIGQTTGDHHQGTGVTQQMFSGRFTDGSSVITAVNNFRIIGHGLGSNFVIHENYRLTIDANGDVTVVHGNFGTDCK